MGLQPPEVGVRRWARRLVVFGAVGVTATAVHGATVWLLIHLMAAPLANALGFLLALVVTYVGNYRYAFSSRAAHAETMVRFAVVSALTLGASEWFLAFLRSAGVGEQPAVLAAVVAVPLLRFGVLATQVFDHERTRAVPLRRWLADAGVWAASAGVGVLALMAVASDGLLDPGSAVWRFPGGDRGVGVAGMRYYLADDWHWPLLLTDDLDAPTGTVIAFTDSIPLLALPTKLARPAIGADVNYFPAWFLLAYTAQGMAAVALLRSLGVRRGATLVVGAVLAVTFPAFVFRSFHPALEGQFIILAALAAAVSSARPGSGARYRAATVAALVVALLIHPYLLFASAPLVVGIYLDLWRNERLATREVLATGASGAVALALVLWAGGYLGHYQLATDYGHYSLNVMGPIYPQLSGLLRGDEPALAVEGTAEGFNWLGFGGLLVVVAALAATGRRLPALVWRWQGVFLGCVTITALAVTHRVAYGRHGLVDLSVRINAVQQHPVRVGLVVMAVTGGGLVVARRRPELKVTTAFTLTLFLAAVGLVMATRTSAHLAAALSPVRGSGRLWWSVGMLGTFAAVALVDRWPRRLAGAVLLLVAAGVQVIDTGPVRDSAQTAVRPTTAPWAEPLRAAAAGASEMRVRPSFFCAPFPEGTFAVLDAIVAASAAGPTPVDTAYTARAPAGLDCGEGDGTRSPNDLLVLVPPDELEPGELLTADRRCRDDGRMLVCSPRWANLPTAATAPFRPVVAEPATFRAGGDAGPIMGDGWGSSEPGEWGRAIPAGGADLAIPLVGDPGPVVVRLRLRSTSAAPSIVTVTSAAGTQHLEAISDAGDREAVVDPGSDSSVTLRLASDPSGPAAEIASVTLLLP